MRSASFCATITLETQLMRQTCASLVTRVGRKIAVASNKDREVIYLFQQLTICFQRFNALLLHDSFPESDASALWSSQ